ncbi:MAG: hypothetical protein OS112_06750 [Methanoregula sp.]|nr:MAG: hypothetical protein OS112_06750 [Methanoregula sp.]
MTLKKPKEPLKTNVTDRWWYPLLLILISAVVSIVVTWFTFQIQWSQTSLNENRNIANSFLNEIEILEPGILYEVSVYSDSTQFEGPPKLKIDPFYPETGLFYSKSGDIGKLEPNLSQKLHRFYYRLTRAETDRKDVNRYYSIILTNSTSNNLERTQALGIIDDIYLDMIDNINRAAEQIPELKEELRKYTKS